MDKGHYRSTSGLFHLKWRNRGQSWAACACLCPFRLCCQPLPRGSGTPEHCQGLGKMRGMEDAAAILSIFLWFPNVETPTEKLETGGKLKYLFTKAQTAGSRQFYPRNSSQELSQRNINKCRSQLNSPLTGTLALIWFYTLVLYMRSWTPRGVQWVAQEVYVGSKQRDP